MNDILTCVKEKEELPETASNLHKNLTFTIERDEKENLPFLDMKICKHRGKLHSAWYQKPTDTGFIMSYHASAPTRHKENIVEGMVYSIYHATLTWELLHNGLSEAKIIWEENSYPPFSTIPLFGLR